MDHSTVALLGLLLLGLALVLGSPLLIEVLAVGVAVFALLGVGILIGERLAVEGRAGGRRQRSLAVVDALPRWPGTRVALRAAVAELVSLEETLARARTAESARPFVDPIEAEARRAADTLDQIARRLGRAAAECADSELNSDLIVPSIRRETAHLERLAAALRAARVGLAELALSGEPGGDLARAVTATEARLTALGTAAREASSRDQRFLDRLSDRRSSARVPDR